MSNNAFGNAKDVDPDLPLSPDGVTYHLTARSENLADRILLVGDPGRVAVVAKHFDEGSVCYDVSHREIHMMTGTYHQIPVSVISTGMGTDNVEIIMNEIHILKEFNVATQSWRRRHGDASATTDGVRDSSSSSSDSKKDLVFDPSRVKIIRVGTCGSPNAEVPLGCLAITRHAVGLDNTCQYYDAPAVNAEPDVQEVLHKVQSTSLARIQIYATRAAPEITAALVAACAALNKHDTRKADPVPAQSYYVGTTCSASGFYGCQGRSVGRFRGRVTVPHLTEELGALRFAVTGAHGAKEEERVANIEMETSSLCYLSNLLGYQAGSVCLVLARRCGADNAFAIPEQTARGLENAIQVALDAITSVV